MQLPLVLAVVARKGGVGKSTLARSIAVQALINGHKAAIIDADEQATSFKWSRRRKQNAPAVVQLDGRTLAEVVTELKGRQAGFIVIDTPPHDQPIINIAAEAADAALIVTQPYPDDLQEVGVAAAILHRTGKAAGIVLNNTPTRAHALDNGAGGTHRLSHADLPDRHNAPDEPPLRIRRGTDGAGAGAERQGCGGTRGSVGLA